MHYDHIFAELNALSEAQPEGCRLYALMDGSIYASEQPPQWSGRITSLAAEFYPANHLELFAYAFEEEGNEASPLLFPLRKADSPLSKRISIFATISPMCSWLWSPLPAEDLAAHLASYIRTEIAGSAAILRPYDPRLTADVIACFSDARREQMLSGISQWVYYDGGDELKTVAGTQPNLLRVDQKGPMVLDAEEQARFEHLANLIALESYIDEHARVVFEGKTADERRELCDAQLAIGKRLATEAMGDLLMIAVLTQRYGKAWIKEMSIQSILKRVALKEAPLREVISAINRCLSNESKTV